MVVTALLSHRVNPLHAMCGRCGGHVAAAGSLGGVFRGVFDGCSDNVERLNYYLHTRCNNSNLRFTHIKKKLKIPKFLGETTDFNAVIPNTLVRFITRIKRANIKI